MFDLQRWIYSVLKDERIVRKSYYKFLDIAKTEKANLPTEINLEITYRCNLKCFFCHRQLSNLENINLSFERFGFILTQFPHLECISVMGLGEPFLNPDFFKMLEYAESKNIGVTFTTNAVMMNEHIIKKLPNNIYSIWCSVDSLKPELYNKMRVGSNLDWVIGNMNLLKRLRPDIPIHIQTLVMKRNMEELPNIIEFAKELKATVNVLYPIITIRELYNEHIHAYRESEIYLKRAEKLAKKLNVKMFSRPLKPEMSYKYVWCTEPWRQPYISLNGNIFSCCFIHRGPNPSKPYNEHYCGVDVPIPLNNYIMGNIFETPFEKIWNSKDYMLLRRTVKETRMHKKLTIQQLNDMRKNVDKGKFPYCKVCLWRWGCAC